MIKTIHPFIQRVLLISIFTGIGLLGIAQTTYIYCGHWVDTEAGKVEGKATIIVDADTITALRNGWIDAPSDVKTVDLKDKWVLPGLIDMHVHIESETNPRKYMEKYVFEEADIAYKAQHFAMVTLDAGFTTVRDVGGTGVNVSLRDAINSGLVKGPRIFTSRKSIAVTGGHADPTAGSKVGLFDVPGPQHGVANGPAECRHAVRYQYKHGADLIKITATGGVLSVAKDGFRPAFSKDELEAIVSTADDLGMMVAAHAHGDEGMRRAVEAGVKTIEHGTMMSEETMKLMIEKDAYLVPTITAGKSVADSAKIPNYYPDIVKPKALFIGPKIQNTFSKAYKMGVPIAFGTDAGVFMHGRNALEFEYMVEAGMPAMEAIQSATTVNAELLGLKNKIGVIKAGAYADLVAVSADPVDDIKTLQEVLWVMKNGTIYKE